MMPENGNTGNTLEFIPFSLSWVFLKKELPLTADNFLNEYRRLNGFLPYEQGYVYLVHAEGSKFYKIGKSTNPDRRIIQISLKMPFPVRLKKIWRSNFMSYSEKFLHSFFDHLRVNGEWFLFPDDGVDFKFLTHPTTVDRIRGAYADHFFDLVNTAEAIKRDMAEQTSAFQQLCPFTNNASDIIGRVEQIFSEISSEIDGGAL